MRLFARLASLTRFRSNKLRPRRGYRSERRFGDRHLAIAADTLEMRLVLSATVTGSVLSTPQKLPIGIGGATPIVLGPIHAPITHVFNVMSYGALGNGKHDDTVAIRSAISAASAAGGGTIYFPAGTYAVDMQPGDPTTGFPAIFPITSSNLTFEGAGPTQTILSGFMPGLLNPVTHWNVTGQSYVAISRFGMFQINTTTATGPISNITIEGMNIDGNLGYTGNFTVGGNTTTGDGWDLTSKAISLNGSQPVNNIVIENTTIDNWRGEEVYAGGSNIGSVSLIDDDIYGTNGDGVSVSGNLLVNGTTIGGSAPGDGVYNGMENFDLGSPQQTIVENSTIEVSSNPNSLHGDGIVYLGLSTSQLVVTNSTITNNWYGILFSEVGSNVRIQGNTFSNNDDAMITSILGLYPQYPTGFSNFNIQGNTFAHSGAAFVSQAYGSGYAFNNLVLNGNTVTYGTVLGGGYYGPKWSGFVVENTTLGAGATDIGNTSAYVGTNFATWTNTTRVGTNFATVGDRVNDFSSATTTVITPMTDQTVLNVNQNPKGTQLVELGPSVKDYPVGFTTTIYSWSMNNWALKADPSWNNFTKNIPVGPQGVKIQVNSKGLFQVVT
jgi:parallel beta-helix repeat protein